MFKRNRRLKNEAAVFTPPAPPSNVINNGTNWAGVVLAATVALPVIVWLAWLALVGLFAAAGAHTPEREAAYFIIGGMCLLVLVSSAGFIGSAVLSRYFSYRQELAKITGEWKYKQLMAARQPVGNSRTMQEDLRLVRLIEAVMTEAYFHLDDHGQYTKNEAKPWAREQAKEVVLVNEREPVGWTMGARVRPWLQEHGVLVGGGDVVDLDRFPDIAAVQHALRLEFEVPLPPGRRAGV